MEAEFPLLLSTYVTDIERTLTELAAALADGEYEQLRRSAHHLKGASMNLGLAMLVDRLQQVEDLARAAQLGCRATHDLETSLTAALGAAQRQAQQVIDGLEQLLRRLAAEVSPS
jgi:HPt (histidine-containing phosphotransfer) domain-containing protein